MLFTCAAGARSRRRRTATVGNQGVRRICEGRGEEATRRGTEGGGGPEGLREKRGYGEGGGWVTGEPAAGEDAGSERGLGEEQLQG